MKPWKLWWTMPVLIFTGITGAGLARADDPMTVDEWAWSQAYGRDVICYTLDDYPSEGGVNGVGWFLLREGFTPPAAAHIINYSVSTWCPRYWPLLERMGRRERHEMPA